MFVRGFKWLNWGKGYIRNTSGKFRAQNERKPSETWICFR